MVAPLFLEKPANTQYTPNNFLPPTQPIHSHFHLNRNPNLLIMKKYLALLLIFPLIWSCDDDDSDFLEACFTYQFSDTTEGQIHFTNCSENASSYLWEFGDGKTSTEKSPVHTFSSSPPFQLIATETT